MEALQEAEDTGELKGLQLPNMKAITHEIFADNTSIFISAEARDFLQVKSIIHKFELASGAELNVQKSLVLALGRNEVPAWVRMTGCEVADRRKRFKFLGVWSGRAITSKEVTDGVLSSKERKLKMWANRYLTWKSRLILIHHICAAIPQHHIMSVGLAKKDLARIES
ncbi:hypothetical protein R1flu_000721 [Riccia fluitans]|uniref:Reverse transcriptase domain-containing protein n=1 Tax=Riccia fluitans TaxID=41844 RepID=A0ABD1Y191_9MARC